MYLKKLTLRNFRCFQDLEIEFNKNMTVIVGENGSGKTAVLEGAAVALGTLFHRMDGISGSKIKKTDAHLKAFHMGSGDDVQPQYPVEISAEAFIKEEQSLVWKRGLNSELGNMTVKDAKDLTAISEEYQRRLREGDASLCLPLIAYYGTGRLWDYHREKRMDIFKQSTRTNGYIDCLDGTANLKLMMNWFQKMTVKKYQKLEDTGESVPELDAVCQAMEKCYSAVTGYENVKIRCNMDTNDLDVSYTEENGMRMRIPLSQMSDGYKSTLSLIADIAYRMANLNPQLLDNILKLPI